MLLISATLCLGAAELPAQTNVATPSVDSPGAHEVVDELGRTVRIPAVPTQNRFACP